VAGYKGPNFGGKVSDKHEVEFTAEQLKAGLYAHQPHCASTHGASIPKNSPVQKQTNRQTKQTNKQAILDRQRADLLGHNRPAPYVAGRASGVNY
jgi:hypothetical protein